MAAVESRVEAMIRVVAGLLELAELRAERLPALSGAVRQVVDELDPDQVRDTSPWRDRDPWVRLDAVDRLRYTHDDLLALGAQEAAILEELRAVSGGYTPGKAYRLLVEVAVRRREALERLYLAERRVRPRLAPDTAKSLSRARRVVQAGEADTAARMERLGRLLGLDVREGDPVEVHGGGRPRGHHAGCVDLDRDAAAGHEPAVNG